VGPGIVNAHPLQFAVEAHSCEQSVAVAKGPSNAAPLGKSPPYRSDPTLPCTPEVLQELEEVPVTPLFNQQFLFPQLSNDHATHPEVALQAAAQAEAVVDPAPSTIGIPGRSPPLLSTPA
jgi:hypothetical protein